MNWNTLHLQCNATLLNVQKTPEWNRKTTLLSLTAGSCILSLIVNAYYKYHLQGIICTLRTQCVITYIASFPFVFVITGLQYPPNQNEKIIGHCSINLRRPSVTKAVLFLLYPNELLSMVTLSLNSRNVPIFQKERPGMCCFLSYHKSDFITINLAGLTFPYLSPQYTSWTFLVHWNDIKDI